MDPILVKKIIDDEIQITIYGKLEQSLDKDNEEQESIAQDLASLEFMENSLNYTDNLTNQMVWKINL